MSKAILVLDKMPKSCSECPALRLPDMFCDASGVVPTLIEDIFTRPACCPLKEAPEKLTSASDKLNELRNANVDPNSGWYGWMTDIVYESGWNNCLKEILGTED